jgi:hypothetical protein
MIFGREENIMINANESVHEGNTADGDLEI